MKFLSAQPPAAIAGQVQQSGRCGPFVRNGRVPVDPRRPAQWAPRAGFGYGAKVFRFGDPARRSGWDAIASSGLSGVTAAAGRNAAQPTFGQPFTADALAPAIPPAASIDSIAWDSAGLLVVSVGGTLGDFVDLRLRFSPPRPPAISASSKRLTLFGEVTPVPVVLDLSAAAAAAWGLPFAGWIFNWQAVALGGLAPFPFDSGAGVIA